MMVTGFRGTTEPGAAAPAGLAIYLLREIPHMRVNSEARAI
jgi:hypothetical protein